MIPRVLLVGLLGGIVAIVWTALVGSLFPLRDRLGNLETPNEEAVLAALDRNLTEGGLYLIPGKFPHDSLFLARYAEGPIFRVHAMPQGAGGLAQFVVSDLALLLAPIVPAWLLVVLCGTARPGYGSRVLVVALFGVFLALAAFLPMWDQELYPAGYVFLLAANGVATWTIVGLVLAWRIAPRPLANVGV